MPYQLIITPNTAQIPETLQRIKYFCSASTRWRSISIVMKQENVHRQLMQRHREHRRAILLKPQVAQPLAGGGCGRPAMIRVVPPMSTLAATSSSSATMSSAVSMPFAPRCGSLLTAKSAFVYTSAHKTEKSSAHRGKPLRALDSVFCKKHLQTQVLSVWFRS